MPSKLLLLTRMDCANKMPSCNPNFTSWFLSFNSMLTNYVHFSNYYFPMRKRRNLCTRTNCKRPMGVRNLSIKLLLPTRVDCANRMPSYSTLFPSWIRC
jgi:hypothetical protein